MTMMIYARPCIEDSTSIQVVSTLLSNILKYYRRGKKTHKCILNYYIFLPLSHINIFWLSLLTLLLLLLCPPQFSIWTLKKPSSLQDYCLNTWSTKRSHPQLADNPRPGRNLRCISAINHDCNKSKKKKCGPSKHDEVKGRYERTVGGALRECQRKEKKKDGRQKEHRTNCSNVSLSKMVSFVTLWIYHNCSVYYYYYGIFIHFGVAYPPPLTPTPLFLNVIIRNWCGQILIRITYHGATDSSG